MAAVGLGDWEPLPVAATVDLFRDAPFRWWISGGIALERHLGRSWRTHEDTDVGLVRRDAVQLGSLLAAWDIHVAAAGRLAPWAGDDLRADRHQNNV